MKKREEEEFERAADELAEFIFEFYRHWKLQNPLIDRQTEHVDQAED